MTFRSWAVLLVRAACVLILSLILLVFFAVQMQQRTLRWRAERLLAEVHQIRLYQSTWADAQRLMHRWGAWGHYDGTCTSASCVYEIEMGNIAHYNPRVPHYAWLNWLLVHDRFNLYQWFGGRDSAFRASVTVHKGTIWRESTAIGVSVPRRRMKRAMGAGKVLVFDDFDKILSMSAGSYQRLHRTLKDGGLFMGGAEGLADHPYYKVGRPSGCMINCQIGVVYYSTHTPPAEIERLTSYDFSCFTQFHPCAELEDLLPAGKEWHLYKEDELKQSSSPENSCDVPVWAMARDAHYVLAVEALSPKRVKDEESYHEAARVRVVSSLKEPAPWLPGVMVRADSFYRLDDAWPLKNGKHFIAGRRYIVFAAGNDRRDQIVTKDSPLTFEWCGVQADTPEVRRDLERGFAQNDELTT